MNFIEILEILLHFQYLFKLKYIIFVFMYKYTYL